MAKKEEKIPKLRGRKANEERELGVATQKQLISKGLSYCKKMPRTWYNNAHKPPKSLPRLNRGGQYRRRKQMQCGRLDWTIFDIILNCREKVIEGEEVARTLGENGHVGM